jgi:pSer/pThr/pTyr-binding forkhead associated (FHA) protein
LIIDAFWFSRQLLDLNSTNGILHNGIRVSEVQLSDGDIITFGGGKSAELNAPPAPEV